MRICLIRHGETDWNNEKRIQGREDIPLNDAGIKQINESAKYLKKFDWKAIITSPLARAKMSAQIISKEIQLNNIYEEIDFIERDYGDASGKTIEETKVLFPDGIWVGSESSESLKNRTVNALNKYIKMFEGNDIIIVSHGGVINSILSFLNINEVEIGKTTLRNGSLTLLKKISDKLEILFFNKLGDELIGAVTTPN